MPLQLFQAIDTELEQKEGYQSFPAVPEQKPPTNTWLNPPIQQQQQQHSSMLLLVMPLLETLEFLILFS